MASRCKNVTQLILPAVTKLDLRKLNRVAQHLRGLEKLEVQLSSDIKPLLLIQGLKELAVQVPEDKCLLCIAWVKEWMKQGFVPVNLTLVSKFTGYTDRLEFLESLLRSTVAVPKEYVSCFKYYYDFQVPLKLFPTLSKNKLVNVTTNVCHNTHYFCVVMFTTFCVVTFTTNFVVNITTLTTK